MVQTHDAGDFNPEYEIEWGGFDFGNPEQRVTQPEQLVPESEAWQRGYLLKITPEILRQLQNGAILVGDNGEYGFCVVWEGSK